MERGLGKPGYEGVVDLFSGRCGAFSGRQRYDFFVNYIVLIRQQPLPANLLCVVEVVLTVAAE